MGSLVNLSHSIFPPFYLFFPTHSQLGKSGRRRFIYICFVLLFSLRRIVFVSQKCLRFSFCHLHFWIFISFIRALAEPWLLNTFDSIFSTSFSLCYLAFVCCVFLVEMESRQYHSRFAPCFRLNQNRKIETSTFFARFFSAAVSNSDIWLIQTHFRLYVCFLSFFRKSLYFRFATCSIGFSCMISARVGKSKEKRKEDRKVYFCSCCWELIKHRVLSSLKYKMESGKWKNV